MAAQDEGTPEQQRRLEILIVGSCVSRDTFEFLDPRRFHLRDYVARQSLISGFGPAAAPLVEPSGLPSRFQQRMVEADAASDLPERVETHAPRVDLLLWDLVDERLGVHVRADGGITTDSVEARSLRGASAATELPEGTRHLPFGSDEHFTLFEAALPLWRGLLERTGLLGRTVLVAPPWAERTAEGDLTPPSFELSATEGNALSQRYVAAARRVLGLPVLGLSLRQEATRADHEAGADDRPTVHARVDHHWGPAPFHYDDATYTVLAEGIADAARRTGRLFGGAGSGLTRVPTALERDPSLRQRIEPSIRLSPSSSGGLAVELSAPPLRAWAFHLYRDGDRVEATGWTRSARATFVGGGPGVYRCRAILLSTSGDRRLLVSDPVRLP